MIVDDDEEMREGLDWSLRDGYSIFSFASGEEAIAAAQHQCYPVAILDLQLGGISGIEALTKLKEITPAQKVIILTGHLTAETAMQAVNLGAFRYLTKPFHPDILKTAVLEAFESYEKEVSRHFLSEDPAQYLRSFALSPREIEVAQALLEGQSNVAISRSLGISARTVEKHVERVLAYFRIESRHKLAQALKERLSYKSP